MCVIARAPFLDELAQPLSLFGQLAINFHRVSFKPNWYPFRFVWRGNHLFSLHPFQFLWCLCLVHVFPQYLYQQWIRNSHLFSLFPLFAGLKCPVVPFHAAMNTRAVVIQWITFFNYLSRSSMKRKERR